MAEEESDVHLLEKVVTLLVQSVSVRAKLDIAGAYAPARGLAGEVRLGDDCAAIPDGDGFLLFAAEGMLPGFAESDPWFAGYSAVMVNLSDVAAMGGWPTAVVDVLWTAGEEHAAALWEGMAAASRAYGVPIVGGHTTRLSAGGLPYLAAAVLGRAERLITSFDALPGDDLLMAVDLRGSYRGSQPFWNTSTEAPPERLRADLALLPLLARNCPRVAGKDISNGGIVGTLAMLLECSRIGAELWLDRLPRPVGVDLERWLITFPSYGYLLSVAPADTVCIVASFAERNIVCAPVGRITQTPGLTLHHGGAQQRYLEETFSDNNG